MKITKVFFKNYRMFKDFEIEIKDGLNVLYGINGVGKSTVIHAVNDLMLVVSQKQGLPSDTVIIPSDRFNDTTKDCVIGLEAIIKGNKKRLVATKQSKFYNSEQGFLTQAAKQPVAIVQPLKKQSFKDGTVCSGDLSDFLNEPAGFLSFLPGLGEHKIEGVTDTQGGVTFKIEFGAKFALAKGIRNFEQFKNWFEIREGQEIQTRLEENNDYRDSQLVAVREAVSKINPSFKSLKIDRKSKDKKLVVDKDGRFFDVLTQLSDGEASIIALVGVLVSAKEQLRERLAIVVIDEIDGSFHPGWQSRTIQVIKDALGDCQLLVSSHSPFVWSGLNREEIIFLVKDEDGNISRDDVDYAIGGSIDSIITDFFSVNLFDEEISKQLACINLLIRQKNGKKAVEKINEMKDMYGDLPVFTYLDVKMRGLGL